MADEHVNEAAASRAALLARLAAAATAVGEELDALDRGAGSWERISACEREIRAALVELPGDDRAALQGLVDAGLVGRWSEVARISRSRAARG